MQNVQNNFTVEDLVAKYRNYVNEHCPKEYFCDDYIGEDGKSHTSKGYMPFSPDGDADEQLIVTLYKNVAGENADEKVLSELSKYADKFYLEALTKEELSFLCENFEEAVTFSFLYLEEHKGSLMYYSIPLQILDIIKENAHVRDEASVFVADACNGDVASLFAGYNMKGYTCHRGLGREEELWALVQIRLYAQGTNSNILMNQEGCFDKSYLEDVDCVVWGTAYHTSFDDAEAIYKSVKPGAQIILFMDKNEAAGQIGETYGIRKIVVEDKAIKSIIYFDYMDSLLSIKREKVVLIIEKKHHEKVHVKNGINANSFDISSDILDSEILWPGYYMAARPENGIPFSDLVTFVDLSNREIVKDENDKWILPEEVKTIPVAVPADMANEYKDSNLCYKELKLAGDPIFEDWKGWIRKLNQPCVLLYGREEKYVVGYFFEMPQSGMCTLDSVVCLIPKEGIDVRYISAILLSSEIKTQIVTVCGGEENDHIFPLVLDKIIVPNHSDKERTEFLAEANFEAMVSIKKEMQSFQNTYEKSTLELKKAQLDKLCNYQHSMRKPVREIGSAVRRMERYINDNSMSDESKDYLQQRIDNIKKQKDNLSEEIDHLSDDNKYNDSTTFDINHCLGSYINYFCNDIEVDFCNVIAKKAIQKYMQSISYRSLKDNEKPSALDRKKEALSVAYVDIAEYNFRKIVKNILDNAEHHGFFKNTSANKTVDIVLDWDSKRNMYQIDFRNNGNPLPIGVTKDSFAEYKKYAGVTGNSGIGGSEVADNVKHYNGDFDVFQDGEWVVVRIYLPKSKAYDKGL